MENLAQLKNIQKNIDSLAVTIQIQFKRTVSTVVQY